MTLRFVRLPLLFVLLIGSINDNWLLFLLSKYFNVVASIQVYAQMEPLLTRPLSIAGRATIIPESFEIPQTISPQMEMAGFIKPNGLLFYNRSMYPGELIVHVHIPKVFIFTREKITYCLTIQSNYTALYYYFYDLFFYTDGGDVSNSFI